MSAANITAFQHKVSASPELQSRLAEIQSQAARTTAETIARLATETGTPFTADELLATAEIPDQALAEVAGGATVVRKDPTEDGFHNLWGLLGKSYNYTTDDGQTHRSSYDHKIGEPYTSRRRVVQ